MTITDILQKQVDEISTIVIQQIEKGIRAYTDLPANSREQALMEELDEAIRTKNEIKERYSKALRVVSFYGAPENWLAQFDSKATGWMPAFADQDKGRRARDFIDSLQKKACPPD